MTDQSLNSLFEKARSEAPETNITEIQKWIGFTGVFALVAGFAFKFKTLFTSKIILMTSSIIIAASLTLGAYFFSPKSEKNAPTTKESQLIQQDLNRKVTLLPIVEKSNGEAKNTSAPIVESAIESNETSVWEALLPLRQLSSIQQSLDTTKNVFSTAALTDEYGNFDALKVSGVVDVVLIQGSASGVRIEADEAGKRVIRISNDNGTLRVYTEIKGKNDHNFKLTVYLTFKDLKKIECSGASDIKSQGELAIDDLFLKISGASDIQLNLKTKQLKVESSGASEIELTGNTDLLTINNSGASDLKAKNFKAKSGILQCSGASETIVYVTDQLKIDVSGASDVKYTGNPSVEKSSSGTSSIKHV